MILKQYYLGCLAHASYLIADETTKEAVVVDPQRDVEQYLEDASQLGVDIRHVFLTHFHADFLAGHLELRDRCGAEIHIGRRGQADYAFVAAAEGDTLDLGAVRLVVLETPGHTPEGISILVYDLEKDAGTPHAVLTGDTLFIGDVGRPDLMASVGVSDVELAGMLYASLHDKLMALPDDTLVYPAHGAGSMCGKNLSSDTVSTVGIQKQVNYALQPMSKERFIDIVTADQPDAPAYFAYDANLNRRERPTLTESLAYGLKPLSLEHVLVQLNAGAQILDVRDATEYAGAHLSGSLNIGLGGKYATWSGTILDHSLPIVLIADPGQEEEGAMRLGRIGFDHVIGYLEGGMAALEARPDLVERGQRVTPKDLYEMLSDSPAPLVVDVRTPGERSTSAIDGSMHVPLNRLPERLGELPGDRTIVFQCATGYRSSTAASLLMQKGHTSVMDLVGGIAAWQASGFPTVGSGASCATAE